MLVEIEARFDVNSLRYKDMLVWPVIRLELWIELLSQPSVKARRQSSNLRKTPHRPGVIRRLQLLFLRFKYWVEHKIQIASLKREQADILFFSGAELHRFMLGDKFYNFYMDPWIEFAQQYYSCIKVEINTKSSRKIQPRVIPPVMLDFLPPPRRPQDNGNISNFEMLTEVMELVTNGVQLSEQAIITKLNYIESYTAFFEDLLRALKPKAVFLICFYDIINMALIKTCKKLGVVSVDLQHGKQGKYHGLYTHWMKLPERGYDFLPDYFWNWGDESRSNINQRSPVDIQHHLPLVGGNLWLNKWKLDDWYVENEEEKKFYARLAKLEKVILYSAQPIDVPFPPHVLEAMRASPETWLWLIRLHPGQKGEQENIQKTLEASGVCCFEISQAISLPLYALLKRCDYHVTCWSTVCYEALVFNVPTSIVHENGRIFYQEYIAKGIFFDALSSEELLKQIKQYTGKNIVPESSPYIVADRGTAKRVLDEIMKSNHLTD